MSRLKDSVLMKEDDAMKEDDVPECSHAEKVEELAPGSTSPAPHLEKEEVTEKPNVGDISVDVVDGSPVKVADLTGRKFPPPSDEFLTICRAVDDKLAPDFRDFAWRQYHDLSENVAFEGRKSGWMVCSLYATMLCRHQISMNKKELLPYSLNHILAAAKVSALEFFDKMSRWISYLPNTAKRLQEHIQKTQSSLSISVVMFKKYQPLFREVFLSEKDGLDPSPGSSRHMTTMQLFELIWLAYLSLKKHLPNEDLISSFNLLVCVAELVFNDLCFFDHENLVNQSFVACLSQQPDSCVLAELCRRYQGVLLDAKHFRTHWFANKWVDILKLQYPTRNRQGKAISPLNVYANHSEFRKTMSSLYEAEIMRMGEFDERTFLPTSAAAIYDPTFDTNVVDLLRRESETSEFEDAQLLLNMATQSCLERLANTKEMQKKSPSSYVFSGELMLRPISPPDNSPSLQTRLREMLPRHYKLKGSELEKMCTALPDSPLLTITNLSDRLCKKLKEQVQSEDGKIAGYDAAIGAKFDERIKIVKLLFCVTIEKIAMAERDRCPDRIADWTHILRKEEFLLSLFCFSLELVLFSYGSVRKFPWSIQALNVMPTSFYKVIEPVIRSELALSRDMVQHLNKVEEEILEKLAWNCESPIWNLVAKNPHVVPNCEIAWSSTSQLMSSYSPVKRRRLEDGTVEPLPNIPSASIRMFFRKVYLLCHVRLTDLFEQLRVDERVRRLVWTLVENVLMSEISLLKGRHIDQNLLCIIYMACKTSSSELPFSDIICFYRQQPQAKSETYREVFVDANSLPAGSWTDDGQSRDSTSSNVSTSSNSMARVQPPGVASAPPTPEPCTGRETVDLIGYYNKIFLPRVEYIIRRFDDSNEDQPALSRIPDPRCFGLSPMKRSVADKVTVMPLHTRTSAMNKPRIVYKYGLTDIARKPVFVPMESVQSKGRKRRVTFAPEVSKATKRKLPPTSPVRMTRKLAMETPIPSCGDVKPILKVPSNQKAPMFRQPIAVEPETIGQGTFKVPALPRRSGIKVEPETISQGTFKVPALPRQPGIKRQSEAVRSVVMNHQPRVGYQQAELDRLKPALQPVEVYSPDKSYQRGPNRGPSDASQPGSMKQSGAVGPSAPCRQPQRPALTFRQPQPLHQQSSHQLPPLKPLPPPYPRQYHYPLPPLRVSPFRYHPLQPGTLMETPHSGRTRGQQPPQEEVIPPVPRSPQSISLHQSQPIPKAQTSQQPQYVPIAPRSPPFRQPLQTVRQQQNVRSCNPLGHAPLLVASNKGPTLLQPVPAPISLLHGNMSKKPILLVPHPVDLPKKKPKVETLSPPRVPKEEPLDEPSTSDSFPRFPHWQHNYAAKFDDSCAYANSNKLESLRAINKVVKPSIGSPITGNLRSAPSPVYAKSQGM